MLVFLITSLPKLSFVNKPTISKNELIHKVYQNLEGNDLKEFKILVELDKQNMRLGNSIQSFNSENNTSSLRVYLLKAFHATNSIFLKKWLVSLINIEEILIGLLCKKYDFKKELAELHFDNRRNEISNFILNHYHIDDLGLSNRYIWFNELSKLIKENNFQNIEKNIALIKLKEISLLKPNATFHIDTLLSYYLELSIIERYFSFNNEVGQKKNNGYFKLYKNLRYIMNFAKVTQVNGNMVTAKSDFAIRMNEIGFILFNKNNKNLSLKAEVIRINGSECDLQVFEDTKDITIGDKVQFTSKLLSMDLGPGLLNNVYDGLGNPLEILAQETGFFLKRGVYLPSLNQTKKWDFKPVANVGNVLRRGDTLGIVKEGDFDHHIMVPFEIVDDVIVLSIVKDGSYKSIENIAKIENKRTKKIINLNMVQQWAIKKPINIYHEKLAPRYPLTTCMRIVDLMFPIAEGGTACIPGPFGSGKTVFQQAVSKYGNADIVIIAACGERAGEVVETLREFPTIIDPKTNKSLMERTIIICNTSSMPVASREASVYTAITISEYYRHMGLRVLVLADSTSRWAQALREMSGRLEEIPGEEAFPAYLSSLISNFYERAGLVCVKDTNLGLREGSVTVIGTVSPAGGNFEEPVTQSTLAVVGCFWGLTYARSYAKRFPAISPIDSWSRYMNTMENELNDKYYKNFVNDSKWVLKYYLQGQAIGNQMKVVGEEDLSLDDYVHYQKSEFFDAAILQQNSFDKVDAGPDIKRTSFTLQLGLDIIRTDFSFTDKPSTLKIMMKITSLFRDLNITDNKNVEFNNIHKKILQIINNKNN